MQHMLSNVTLASPADSKVVLLKTIHTAPERISFIYFLLLDVEAEVVLGICKANVSVVFSGQQLLTLKRFTACSGKWVNRVKEINRHYGVSKSLSKIK